MVRPTTSDANRRMSLARLSEAVTPPIVPAKPSMPVFIVSMQPSFVKTSFTSRGLHDPIYRQTLPRLAPLEQRSGRTRQPLQ